MVDALVGGPATTRNRISLTVQLSIENMNYRQEN
jgi:hypothetical protein